VAEPQPRWQALLVGVASSAYGENPGFTQAVNSQEQFARVIERNLPGLHEDDLIVLPEPRYAHEVTAAIAELNQAHDEDGAAGRVRPGLLFYFCGHGMNVDERLYLSMVETVDDDTSRRLTGLALGDVLEAVDATLWPRRRVVLILDCCFAGLAREEPGAKRAHLLMAVGPDVKATHDPDSDGPTHFTGALVELLRDGDPGIGEWIDLATTYQWLRQCLVGRYGETRQPYQRAVGESGRVVLGRNRAFA
jgi:hypothetical protein